MTITRKLTSTLTALAIAAASLAPLATSANAGPRGYGHGHGYGYGYGHGHHYDHGYDGYRGGRDRYYARHYRKKNNTGKYVAIGAAALMLGIIASEAGRR